MRLMEPDRERSALGELVEFKERDDHQSDTRPVPAARSLGDFAWERVGDDLVVFDAETLHYHTLNGQAVQVWTACDGTATVGSITQALHLPVEVVEATVAQLGEGGLLQATSAGWDAAVNRRRATRLIAAGLVGAVGLPVIKSITVPDAASAASNLPNGSGCEGNSECLSGCCLDVDGAWNTCRDWQIPVSLCNQIYTYGQVCSPGPVTMPFIGFTVPCM